MGNYTASFVYLMNAVGTDFYKIGTTNSLEDRIADVRTQHPSLQIEYAAYRWVNDAREAKAYFYTEFSNYRYDLSDKAGKSTEWFLFKRAILNEVLSEFDEDEDFQEENITDTPEYDAYDDHYNRQTFSDSMPSPIIAACVVVGIVVLIGWGGLTASLNAEANHLRTAYAQIHKEANSGTEQYLNAAANFQRLASESSEACVDEFALSLKNAANEAANHLSATIDYETSWQIFVDREEQARSRAVVQGCSRLEQINRLIEE